MLIILYKVIVRVCACACVCVCVFVCVCVAPSAPGLECVGEDADTPILANVQGAKAQAEKGKRLLARLLCAENSAPHLQAPRLGEDGARAGAEDEVRAGAKWRRNLDLRSSFKLRIFNSKDSLET